MKEVVIALVVAAVVLIGAIAVAANYRKAGDFYKVSYVEFARSMRDTFSLQELNEMGAEDLKSIYTALKYPKRATRGSAGYDFYSPITFTLKPGESIKFPTGIRCKMRGSWVLMCFPRSGLGFKYRIQLNNTVGIIDADYYYTDREGHIWAKLTNDSKEEKTVLIGKGEAFMQGVFLKFGITKTDESKEVRTGGFGSTGGKH